FHESAKTLLQKGPMNSSRLPIYLKAFQQQLALGLIGIATRPGDDSLDLFLTFSRIQAFYFGGGAYPHFRDLIYDVGNERTHRVEPAFGREVAPKGNTQKMPVVAQEGGQHRNVRHLQFQAFDLLFVVPLKYSLTAPDQFKIRVDHVSLALIQT